MRLSTITHKPVRAAVAAAIGLGVVAGGAALAEAATGTVKPTGANLTVRSGPGTSYRAVGSLAKGTRVDITCQTRGTTVSGPYGTSSWWDKIGSGRFVADAYIYTGSDGRVAPLCGGVSSTPSGVKDDYPYRGQGTGVDPWNFYKGQCTSFAAWRVNHNLGIRFSNSYKGQHWGNAEHWDNAARAAGIPVYKTPKVGDIAVRSSGTYGHVAYVAKVNADGTFMVEEYNHVRSDTYSYRKAHRGTDADGFTDFIRFKG